MISLPIWLSLCISVMALSARAGDVPVGRVELTISHPTEIRGDATNALRVVVWYPALDGTVMTATTSGPPDAPLFDTEKSALNAPLAARMHQHPLIVLSHGTGGSALQLAWLATRLAGSGYIVAAPDHPGNNAYDPYTPQGFTFWWLRAGDLSSTIDALLADSRFGPSIDRTRIGAAGFSLGGYTVLELAGARTDFTGFMQRCKQYHTCEGPPEFPDVVARMRALVKHDPALRAELGRASASYADPRIRAIFAIAPALGASLSLDSLARISIPTAVVVGGADAIAPPALNAEPIARAIPRARLTVLPGVAHLTFLDRCLPAGRARLAALCADPEGVDRGRVHDDVASDALRFFDETLSASP